MKTPESVHYADCDQFENHRTGYYANSTDAEAAFWRENVFSDSERARVVLYTREVLVDQDVLDDAELRARAGSPSPGLFIS